jgi:transcriptional regulator of arginine metabolism
MTLAHTRLEALKKLLLEGSGGTQEELVEALLRKKFSVTQSTISRDLRRLGVIKVNTPEGKTVYRLSQEQLSLPISNSNGLRDLLVSIDHNDAMIVIHTSPGSASLVARHLDMMKQTLGLLGTIAGDDTIFVAPAKTKKIQSTVDAIIEELS